ncbi:MAG: chromosome segregation protein SMC [Firmicutes bacterium]|nr:chromosome segregation protein SMC [Bacillota bacterium]
MYFKRLEMHGFKSFAEPVVIEFHEGVTAVVGPNGSGKSNISDAIRWVLGEQSPKALRGGKMEEVIFAGTASRKSRGMAEVTLVIDNSTGILPIDYNEVAITRRMFRSGESEYLINNNQCRLRDIRELIMDTGIGVDGYSVIGQGKIADIVSNKTESRREIFEEAAGVVMYKSKKADAEKKLANTNQNLERIDDIIGEIEDRIDGLREDSIKAKEFKELKARYEELEINITLKNIENLTSANEKFKEDIAELQKQLDEYNQSKAKIDAQVADDREKSEELEQLANASRDKLLHIKDSINNLQNESQLNEERLAGIDKDYARIKGEIADFEAKLEKEDQEKERLTAETADIKKSAAEATDHLHTNISTYNEVTREKAALAAKIDESQNLFYKLQHDVTVKKGDIRSYESLKETLENRKAQLASEEAETARTHADSKAQLENAEAELSGHKDALAKMSSDMEGVAAERASLEQSRKANRLHMEELKLAGGQKTARKKTIEEMESNYEGYNFAVKYIMRANLPGIEGVVADLMKVPAGYETAIETALGAQMQNIICATDQDAKKAVNALKESKAGRLTFLPVASIKGSSVRLDPAIEHDKKFKGIASSVIEADAKYQNVFSYLLGRVAIVEDMDTAIRLSKTAGQGLRFVTLDGEIINASGAITGGKFKNKTANLLERKSEIQKLEAEIEELRNQLLSANREEEQVVRKLEQLNVQLQDMDARKREAELAAAALESSVASMRDVLGSFEFDRQKAERELQSIDEQVRNADESITQLRKSIADGYAEIDRIESESETLEQQHKEKSAAVEDANEAITKSRIAVNEWTQRLSHTENLLQRVTETIDDYTFQKEERERQISNLLDEKNNILFGSSGREEEVAKMLQEKQDVENYITDVTAERAGILEKISKVTAELDEAGSKINSCRDQKYQLEVKYGKNESQLETQKEKLWDEFEISYAQALDYKKADFVMSTSMKESREIRNRIRALGDVNVGAIEEYEKVRSRYEHMTREREDVVTAMNQLREIINTNDSIIKQRFKESFDQIVENFEIIFKELFGGGHAELRMEDESNPLESGIDIIAQPPGKKLQNINLMSGGEKTMTAIALMFAVLKTKPTPFCILDEVEAALDDANIDRFAKALRKFNNIQFTLVTHQKATMEHADVLYGVTMPEHGISRVLSLRLGDDFEL